MNKGMHTIFKRMGSSWAAKVLFCMGVAILLPAIVSCKRKEPLPSGVLLSIQLSPEFNRSLITSLAITVDKSPFTTQELEFKDGGVINGRWGEIPYQAQLKDVDNDGEKEWIAETTGNPLSAGSLKVRLVPPDQASVPLSVRITLTGQNGMMGKAEQNYDDQGNLLRLVPGKVQLVSVLVSCIPGLSCRNIENHPPRILLANRTPKVAAGSRLIYSVAATDPDGDPHTLSAKLEKLPQGHNAAFDGPQGKLTWTPAAAMAGGPYEVIFRAIDSLGATAEESIAITVLPEGTNSPPVFDPVGALTTFEGNGISFAISAVDPDGDTVAITLDVAGLPEVNNATYSEASHLFSWSPTYGDARAEPFVARFSADDGKGGLTALAVKLTVLATNRPPVFVTLGAMTVKEGVALSFEVLATDPEGAALTYTAELGGLPENHGASFQPTSRIYTWKPAEGMRGGPYPVIFAARDASGAEGRLTVEITVLTPDSNCAPIFKPVGEQIAYEGERISFTVEAVDLDSDNDSLTYSADLSGLPNGHGASFNENTRTFTWITGEGAASNTPYSTLFTVRDASLAEGTLSVRLLVKRNRAPVFTSESLEGRSVDETQLLSFGINAIDGDGDNLTISIDRAGLPAGNNASFDEYTRTFTWTPGYEHAGVYSLAIEALDARGARSRAQVAITVANVDRAPQITEVMPINMQEGQSREQVVTCSDPDNDPATLSMVEAPSWVSVDESNSGGTPSELTLVFTPGFSVVPARQESRFFDVKVRCVAGPAAEESKVRVWVSDNSTPPIFAPIEPVTVTEGSHGEVALSATDAEGEIVTFALKAPLSWATVDRSRNMLVLTPGYEMVHRFESEKNFIIKVVASDGIFYTEQSAMVKVLHKERPPDFSRLADQVIKEGRTMRYGLNAVDPDGDAVTFMLVSGPSWATVSGLPWVLSLSPPIDAVPSGAESAVFPVEVIANDGVLTAEMNLNITVTAVNAPPLLGEIRTTTVQEGSTTRLGLIASDPDGDNLTFSVIGNPGFASVSGATLMISPGYNTVLRAEGTREFTFAIRASDGTLFAERPVTIGVTHQERPPSIAAVPNQALREGQKVAIALSGSDPDNDGLTFSRLGAEPSWASVAESPWRLVLAPPYNTVPQGGDNITTIVTLAASDGISEAHTSFTVSVSAVFRAPEFTAPQPVTLDEGTAASVELSAVDPDGDNVTFSILDGPDWAQVNGSTLDLAPGHEVVTRNEGTEDFILKIRASDGTAHADQSFTVTVSHVNRPPQLEPLPEVNIYECAHIWTPLSAGDPDSEDLPLNYTLSTGSPPWVTLGIQGDWMGLNISPDEMVVPEGRGPSIFEVTIRAADADTHCEQTVRLRVYDNAYCKAALGGDCFHDVHCASNSCSDNVCCDSDCDSPCRACNLTGSVGACSAVTMNEDSDSCTGNNYCDSAGACQAKKLLGQVCTAKLECASGQCVDGVCCDGACNGACQACNLIESKGTCTGYGNGTDPESECGLCAVCNGNSACANVSDGQDLKDDCPAQPESTCQLDGACNGLGACRQWAAGTVCGVDSCAGATKYLAARCNGTGACLEGGATQCQPFVCNGEKTDCLANCVSDGDCTAGFWCNRLGACVAKLENGLSCNLVNAFSVAECSGNELPTAPLIGHWTFEPDEALVDRTGNWGTLALNGASIANGRLDVDSGTWAVANRYTGPPITEKTLVAWLYLDNLNVQSGAAMSLDAITVDKYDGIVYGEQEHHRWMAGSTGFGRTTTPVPGFEETQVGQLVQMAISYKNDGGATITLCRNGAQIGSYNMGALATHTAGDSEMLFGPRHSSNGTPLGQLDARIEEARLYGGVLTCAQVAALAPCESPAPGDGSNQCASSICADGVCCDGACDGPCQACNLANSVGACSSHQSGTDPENDCGLCATCNGSSACSNAPAGEDPKEDCAPQLESTCQADGACNGQGTCRLWADGTLCGVTTCTGTTKHPADRCNGAGVCVISSTIECQPYVCNAESTDCRANCIKDSDCMAGFWCNVAGACVAKQINSLSCDPANASSAMECDVSEIPGVPLLGHWTFEPGETVIEKTGYWGNFTLNGANIANGRLDVSAGAWAVADGYTGAPIVEKTLVAWLYLDNLEVQNGAPLSIDAISADRFDGIVYSEQQYRRWMAGSSNFSRTATPVPGFEESQTGQLIQMAISYKNNGGATITLCRNGVQIGSYTKGSLASHVAGDSEMLFGPRHSYFGSPIGQIDARIEEARIYGGVLTCAQAAALTLCGKVDQGDGSNQCQSSNCTDGVCCDGACQGTCMACNLASSLGTCASVTLAEDPDSCTGEYYCNGIGLCEMEPPNTSATQPLGDGTAGNPFQIATLSDLSWLTQNSAYWSTGKYYIQTADIDAANTQYWDDADDNGDGDLYNDANDGTSDGNNEGFKPIGNLSARFYGNYNGDNHRISNLSINRAYPGSGGEIGLFGFAQGGTIENISLEDMTVTADINYYYGVGLLMGGGYNGTVSNITISGGSLTASGAYGYVGALVGRYAGGTITNCTSSASVEHQGAVSCIGGLIGYINASSGSYSISDSGATGNVTTNGGSRIGGFAGELGGIGTASRCFSSGNVTNANGGYVAGFVGNAYETTVLDCYTTSTISSTSSSSVGGFFSSAPTADTNKPTFIRCYAASVIAGGSGGGFGGYSNYTNNYTDCFWDITTTGNSTGVYGDKYGGGLTGKITTEMKSVATFSDTATIGLETAWDFVGNPNDDAAYSDNWNIDVSAIINSGYPYFTWQEAP